MGRTVAAGLTLIASIIAVALATFAAQAQQAPIKATPPLSVPRAEYYRQNPQQYQRLLDRLAETGRQAASARQAAPQAVPGSPGTWANLAHAPSGVTALQNPRLMTDGTVLAQDECATDWWKLTPDITGSYLNGAWTQIASLPSGYFPLFYGSGVLPDGRLIIVGGEYNNLNGNCGNPVWTNKSAIYDPVANTWTAVTVPSGWTEIGDAAGVVLPNGTYMQSECCSFPFQAALLNPTTLAWTVTGTSKADSYDEEGFALLQNGTVLDVNAYTSTGTCGKNSETYNPGTGTWSTAGNTIDQQADCSGEQSFELGPLVVRQNGTAVIFPGITTGVGTADVYTPGTGWAAGTLMPSVCGATNNLPCTLADAPAAVLPDGNILFPVSPSNWTSQEEFPDTSRFFEMNLAGTLTQTGNTGDSGCFGAYTHNFLVLPTGEVLDLSQCANMQIYTPLAGSYLPAWQPVVTSVPNCVSPGGTYTASGTQLNGLTEGSYYGDDEQASVNMPIIRIVNNSTSHVFYAKTFNHSTRSIAPGVAVSTSFTVASATETGASKLYDVGAGIPSAGTAITVSNSCSGPALADSHDFNGDTKSDVLFRNGNTIGMWLMNAGAVIGSGNVATVTAAYSVVGARDFNGDGKADLLWHDTSGNVYMWFMNGVAMSSSATVGNAPTIWSIKGTGDMNGDGKGDILWQDTSGDLAIWFMSAGTVSSSASIGTVAPSTNWTILGDTTGGILWQNTASGALAVWKVNNTTVTSSALGSVSSNWVVQGIGDFNGDGNPDILFRDSGTGTVAIWFLNSGGTVGSSANVATVAPAAGWTILQTGDFNGDNKSDILWTDASGNLAIWFMNASTVSSSSGIGNTGGWSVQTMNSE